MSRYQVWMGAGNVVSMESPLFLNMGDGVYVDDLGELQQAPATASIGSYIYIRGIRTDVNGFCRALVGQIVAIEQTDTGDRMRGVITTTDSASEYAVGSRFVRVVVDDIQAPLNPQMSPLEMMENLNRWMRAHDERVKIKGKVALPKIVKPDFKKQKRKILLEDE